MLVVSLRRREYFPRTISPRSDRRYSDRSQSFFSDLGFFINLSLRACSQTGADDPQNVFSFRMGNHQQAAVNRHSKSEKAIFREGMIWVNRCRREWIA